MLPTTFQQGLRVADYVVERELARGGQGVVLEATHASQGTRVALKLLLEPDPEGRQRFLREAKTLARLSHPNLIRVSDHGLLPEGTPYLVMELIRGEDLASWVRTRGLPSREEVVEVLRTLAGVLHFCHLAGVVHRDVKPENVLLEEGTGRVLLVDFGLIKRQRLAAAWSTQDMNSLTEAGDILGTPAYMAPEQASSEFGPITPATDIYALGGVLYFLLTGARPFEGGTLVNTLVQVMETPAPDPRALDPTISAGLATLCLACLNKSPQERPPGAEAFAAGLEAAALAPRGLGAVILRWAAGAIALGVGLGLAALALAPGAGSPASPAPLPSPTASREDPGPESSPAASRVAEVALPEDDFNLLDGNWSRARKAALLASAEQAAKEPSAESLTNLARARLASGDRVGAREAVERALALDPESSVAYRVRGMIAAREERVADARHLADAKRDLDRALELDPGDWVALRERGVVLANIRDGTQPALADFAASLRIRPSAGTYIARGYLLSVTGQRPRGKRDYERALELDPGAKSALYALAQCAEDEHDLRGALAYVARILALSPRSRKALRARVELLAQLKEHRLVIEAASLLEEVAPRDTTGPLRRAFAHQHLGDYEASIAPAERLLELEPGHRTGLLLLLRALYGTQRWARSVALADRILALEPPLAPKTRQQVAAIRDESLAAQRAAPPR